MSVIEKFKRKAFESHVSSGILLGLFLNPDSQFFKINFVKET